MRPVKRCLGRKVHCGGGGRGIINKIQSWAVNIPGGGSRE